jgi:hypothetical protein
MAGSLNHVVGEDGRFTMDCLDNLGDAHEALEECFAIIHDLAEGDMARISAVCRRRNFPDPFKSEYGEPAKPAMRLS